MFLTASGSLGGEEDGGGGYPHPLEGPVVVVIVARVPAAPVNLTLSYQRAISSWWDLSCEAALRPSAHQRAAGCSLHDARSPNAERSKTPGLRAGHCPSTFINGPTRCPISL